MKVVCKTCGSDEVQSLWLTKWNAEIGERRFLQEFVNPQWWGPHYCNKCGDRCDVLKVFDKEQEQLHYEHMYDEMLGWAVILARHGVVWDEIQRRLPALCHEPDVERAARLAHGAIIAGLWPGPGSASGI